MDENPSFLADETDLYAWIQAEMKDRLNREICKILDGPAFFGPGRFDVARDARGRWTVFPCKGYYPMEKDTLGSMGSHEWGHQETDEPHQ